MNEVFKFLLALIIILGMSFFIFSMIQGYGYEGMDEFCEERNMSFAKNFGDPICYKINEEEKINYFEIGKIKGEIFIE